RPNDHRTLLANWYQDKVLAPVRVIVRVNTGQDARPAEPEAKIEFVGEADQQKVTCQTNATCLLWENKQYGQFFRIFPPQCTNEQMLTTESSRGGDSIEAFFDQLCTGYSNIMFGYGFSGS